MNQEKPLWQFKRGATFSERVRYSPRKGDLLTLEGASLKCGIMDANGNRWELTPTLEPDHITIYLYAPSTDTIKWDVGIARLDLYYKVGSTTSGTDTFTFEIGENITYEPDTL